jgi:diguanylate cyclase (GGDEF)-like protein
MLQAIGYSLLLFLQVEEMYLITYFGFPFVVAGQIYIFKGILVFLNRKYRKDVLLGGYIFFIVLYLYYSLIVDNIVIRSVLVSFSIALILAFSAWYLIHDTNRANKITANYVAIIYFLHMFFLLIYIVDIVVITNNTSYESFRISVFRIIAYVVPIISSTLTIYGLILMVNQKLNTENKQLLEQVELEKNRAEKDAMTDELTGLMNRRFLNHMLDTEFNRAIRLQTRIALVMIDVDYFKNYNDCYGHVEGDACLKRIGKTIAEVSNRGTDIAARYGGEEFLIVLPETDNMGALIIARRIKKAIDNLKIEHDASLISKYVTVSIGVRSMKPNENSSVSDVIENVDHLLYQAKENGRNQIVSNNILNKN